MVCCITSPCWNVFPTRCMRCLPPPMYLNDSGWIRASVDNPVSPNLHYTTLNPLVLVHEVIQDFYPQQYGVVAEGSCRDASAVLVARGRASGPHRGVPGPPQQVPNGKDHVLFILESGPIFVLLLGSSGRTEGLGGSACSLDQLYLKP